MEAAAARGTGGEAPAAGAWAPCAGRPPVVDASLDLGAPSCRAGGFACLALEATGGRSLLAGGVDGRVSLFDVGAQNQAPRARASARGAARHAHCVAGASWYCADGGAFATCCAGGRARFWDAARLEPVVAWALGGAAGRDCACAPAAAGPLAATFAAACGDGSVRLCDPRSGSRADALAALHRGAARCVAWAPGQEKGDSTSLQCACSARARFGNSTHASRALREMIARPKISRNERKTAEI